MNKFTEEKLELAFMKLLEKQYLSYEYAKKNGKLLMNSITKLINQGESKTLYKAVSDE